MRRILSILVVLLVILVVGVAGLGFYREWFHFGKTSDAETGQTEFKLNVDKNKVKSDIEKAREKVSPVKTEAESH